MNILTSGHKENRICRYNVTCENTDCKNYKKVIGRDSFNISCPICGEIGRHHSQKCKALTGGEIRCVCNVKAEWHGVKNYTDYWIDEAKRRKERLKNKSKRKGR